MWGSQFLVILDLWGISFHAMVVFGLGKDLLFKTLTLFFKYLYCFSAVGEDKVIDVIDVHTQETIVMNVKEFCQAFETPVEERTSTLNCLGLEVSELPLGNFKP